MTNANVGELLKSAMNRKKLDKNSLAKKVKISPGFLGHLLYSNPVRFSDRLFDRLCETLAIKGVSKGKLNARREAFNKKAAILYKAYNKKYASKKRK